MSLRSRTKIDVMALTETWLKPGDVDQASKNDNFPHSNAFRCVVVVVLCKKALLAKVNPARRFNSFEYMDHRIT